jgi:aspartate-semialdehyde dehydrogenase
MRRRNRSVKLDRAAPVFAIVGGNSLLGREIRDLLAPTRIKTKLIGVDETEAGTLTEVGGEPAVLTPLDEDNLAGADATFLAGSPASSKEAVEIIRRLESGSALIDLTYFLEDRPTANLRAPMAEPANYSVPPDTEHVIAHPAAILLAVLLVRLSRLKPIRRSVAQIFEPASERGMRGLDELQKQTTGLLTFQKLPKDIYDEQVAFNLLAEFGSDSSESIEKIETRIEKHLATLLSINVGVPMPSFRVVQAPVFHGYTISLWVEFEDNPGAAFFEQALAGEQIEVRGPDLDPPHIVGIAGQDGLALGAIRQDRNNPRAVWFWLVADNIRIVAENAVAVARTLIGRHGTAKPQ